MITRQLLTFSAVGVIGFIVDTTVLYLAIHLLGAGLYTGRMVSFLVAATSNWALNRRFTFSDQQGANRTAEWVRFLAANSVGGIVNYSTYSLIVSQWEIAATHPVLGVAAGSLAGLAMNFTLSRRLVFIANRPST